MNSLNPFQVISTFVCYALLGLAISAVAAVCLGYGALLVFSQSETLAGPAFAVGAGIGILMGIWTGTKYFLERIDYLRGGMS